MYATICRYQRVASSTDEIVQAGHRLTSVLSRAPGFISCAVLDASNGVLASVSVFETRTQLERADRLLATWMADHLAASSPCSQEATTGEVIIQKGL
jgi:hypothetical protein